MKKTTAASSAKNELTIGLDLGDRKHHACVLSAAGEIFREEVLPPVSVGAPSRNVSPEPHS